MPSSSRRRLTPALAALAFAAVSSLAACGGKSDDAVRDTIAANEAATSDSSSAAEAAGDDGSVELWDISAADVDAYVRSLDAKTDSLRVGSKRVKAIKDSKQHDSAYVRLAHTLTYYQAMIAASGLPEARYESISRDIDNAFLALTDESTSEETKRETLAHLRPDALAALKRQAPHMTELRKEQDRLVAEAGGFDKLGGAQ